MNSYPTSDIQLKRKAFNECDFQEKKSISQLGVKLLFVHPIVEPARVTYNLALK